MISMDTINISKISRLRTFSDGDGVSTLVGCTGCPLRCAYCFNPFSWDGSVKSKNYTIDDLYDEVKKDNIYFLSTGGGIVFGGGEPLLYHKFIRKFIDKYKSTGWKFTLETSLSTNREFLENLIDSIDYFIVDIKDLNKERYELYTKGDYDLFISNLKFLIDNVDADRIMVRVPKIPKLNNFEDVKFNEELLINLGFKNIDIFEYIDLIYSNKFSKKAFENKMDFFERLKKYQFKFIENYITSSLILKFTPLLDFHRIDLPKSLHKNTEYIFEYDSIFDKDLKHLKEMIISKLQECYDYLGLKYNFYVILYPSNHLNKDYIQSKIFNDSQKNQNIINFLNNADNNDKNNYALDLWIKNKNEYLEFKYYCWKSNKLNDYIINYNVKIDSKYILSDAYIVFPLENKIKINIKQNGKKYSIVEKSESTHVLIQNLNNKFECISEEIISG